MIVSIHQPQYLPWIGYFDKINKSDIFVLLDNVQFKKNEWQNRNKIRNKKGWQWITVPVKYKFPELINEVKINNLVDWKKKHYQSLVSNYNNSLYFKNYQQFFEQIYQYEWNYLADINISLIKKIIEFLNIKTKLIKSSEELKINGKNTQLLINICKKLNADVYLSGIGGKDYLDISQFEREGIKIIFQEFKHFKYQQVFKGFEFNMSIVDLLFNCGENSLNVINNGNL